MLKQIVRHKWIRLKKIKQERPLPRIKEEIAQAPEARDFNQALKSIQEQVALIAEIKKASPSTGLLANNFFPESIAREYEAAGAAALSIVTEERFFLGTPQHIATIRKVTGLPLLRKDFIIDPYQVYETRALGADALLLIAAVLAEEELKELLSLTKELGMNALVETAADVDLRKALRAGAEIIGINNRNLQTLETDIGRTLEMGRSIPRGCLLVSESGIKSHSDIKLLQDAGVDAVLIGEALMRADDRCAKIRELLKGHAA